TAPKAMPRRNRAILRLSSEIYVLLYRYFYPAPSDRQEFSQPREGRARSECGNFARVWFRSLRTAARRPSHEDPADIEFVEACVDPGLRRGDVGMGAAGRT